MALIRCPKCGRVANSNMCFACGHEWSDDAVAPASAQSTPKPPSAKFPGPAPAPKPPASFNTAAPSSFPVAAPVQASAPALEQDIDIDAIEMTESVDLEGDVSASGAAPPLAGFSTGEGLADSPGDIGFSPSPPALPPDDDFAPAPGPSPFGPNGGMAADDDLGDISVDDEPPPPVAPPAQSFAPPDAFGGTPALGTRPPSRKLGNPTSSGSFGPTIAATAGPHVNAQLQNKEPHNPWGAPAPANTPPRVASSKFGALPQAPSLAAPPVLAALPTPQPSAVASSWGANPTVAVSGEAQQVLAALAAAPESSLDGKNDLPAPPPMPAVPPRAPTPRARMQELPSAPASLRGLFDNLDGLRAKAAAPASPTPPAPPAPAPPSSGLDDLSFSLEPGSTIEPGMELGSFEPTSAPSVHARHVPQESPSDLPPHPPPGAAVASDGGFAEVGLDLDVGLDDLGADLPAPPALDFGGPAATPMPSAPSAPSAPPLQDFTPAPPAAPPQAFAPAQHHDEASFADLGLVEDSSQAAPATPPGATIDDGIDDPLAGLNDLSPPAELPPLQALPGLDDLAPDPLAGLDDLNAPPAAAPTGPTLSSRVGTLAEQLEEGGRFADAALLYEVQAALSAIGR